MTGKEIYVDIQEVKTRAGCPTVAENIALQLERRISSVAP